MVRQLKIESFDSPPAKNKTLFGSKSRTKNSLSGRQGISNSRRDRLQSRRRRFRFQKSKANRHQNSQPSLNSGKEISKILGDVSISQNTSSSKRNKAKLPLLLETNQSISNNSSKDKERLAKNSSRRSRKQGKAKNLSPSFKIATVRANSSNQQNSSSRTKSRQTKRSRNSKVHNKTSNRSAKSLPSIWLYSIRLLIVGIGMGAIVGTLLSAFTPINVSLADTKQVEQSENSENPESKNNTLSLLLNQELLSLKEKVKNLAAQNPQLEAGAFFIDLDNGAYLDVEGTTTFSAASTIKLPILIAFFQDVDANKIRLNEMLTMEAEMVAGGSGNMKLQKPGKQYSALETVTKMIAISDNTATNMIIHRLGGAEALNQRFLSWGLTVTKIRQPLPDLEGTNTTSPQDLGHLLAMINQGELVTLRSRDRLLDIMNKTVTNTLISKGLGKGANFPHKTGDIGSVLADAGLVDMPNGKRYIAVVMVKRPHNHPEAKPLIQKISSEIYQYFNQTHSPRAPNMTATPDSNSGIIANRQGNISN